MIVFSIFGVLDCRRACIAVFGNHIPYCLPVCEGRLHHARRLLRLHLGDAVKLQVSGGILLGSGCGL